MKRSHVALLFLLALHIIELPKLQATEVMWDFAKDVIYHDGKLYYPDHNGNDAIVNNTETSTEIPQKENSDDEKEEKIPEEKSEHPHGAGEHEEEELATGGEFWFCIFMIFSMLIFYFFFHFLNINF